MAKMSKKERKKHQKMKGKDKISTKDAKVLTGGLTLADNAEQIQKMTAKVSAKSKKIKKAVGANEITKEQVMAKLKSRRLAIPHSRFKN